MPTKKTPEQSRLKELETLLSSAEGQIREQHQRIGQLEANVRLLAGRQSELQDELDQASKALCALSDLYRMVRQAPFAESAQRRLQRVLDEEKDKGHPIATSVWVHAGGSGGND